MRGEIGGGMSRWFSDASEAARGREQRGEGRSRRLGYGFGAGVRAPTGAEGPPATFFLGLEFQPDGSVQLGPVVHIGGVQVDPRHVGPGQVGFVEVRPIDDGSSQVRVGQVGAC